MNLHRRLVCNRKGHFSGLVRVSLVDISGETSTRYSPLALMCLKAIIQSDPDLSKRVAINIHAFTRSISHVERIEQIRDAEPDVIGFTCQGWNLVQVGQLLSPLRALLPNAVIMLGGNHVTERGKLILHRFADIDLVINGEGELTFREIMLSLVRDDIAWRDINGISFWDEKGVVTTQSRSRVRDLVELPSPYLMVPPKPEEYDVALLETNRGCPYHCGFCYWGGAVGQKMAIASMDRIRNELELIAGARIRSIFLCDANFGILPQDVEIARAVVDVYRRFGYPQAFHVNWAKAHSARIKQIMEILSSGGIVSNIYVALQTLSPKALSLADRTEKGRAETVAMAKEMIARGIHVGCELIFGLPGEGLQEFFRNYDRAVMEFPLVMVHPLWVLPNTSYDERRVEYGIVSTQSDPTTDYESILQHNDLTIGETREGLAFLLSDEILMRTKYAGNTIRAIARMSKLSASDCLRRFEAFVTGRKDHFSQQLSDQFHEVRRQAFFSRDIRAVVRQVVFGDVEASRMLLEEFLDTLPLESSIAEIIGEFAKLDCAMLPRGDLHNDEFSSSSLHLSFDIESLRAQLLSADPSGAFVAECQKTSPITVTLQHRGGYFKHMRGEANDVSNLWHGTITGKFCSQTRLIQA